MMCLFGVARMCVSHGTRFPILFQDVFINNKNGPKYVVCGFGKRRGLDMIFIFRHEGDIKLMGIAR